MVAFERSFNKTTIHSCEIGRMVRRKSIEMMEMILSAGVVSEESIRRNRRSHTDTHAHTYLVGFIDLLLQAGERHGALLVTSFADASLSIFRVEWT